MFYKDTQKKHPFEKAALLAIEDNWEFARFVADNPKLNVRDNPPEFVEKCLDKIPEFFGTPIAVVFSVMPDEEWKLSLVGWIQWHGHFDDGMERYFKFEEWYIDQDFDLETDSIHFSIVFLGEE